MTFDEWMKNAIFTQQVRTQDEWMRLAFDAATKIERERINALVAEIRAHWIKANGFDSISVSALDVIAGVIADGSYVERAKRKLLLTSRQNARSGT